MGMDDTVMDMLCPMHLRLDPTGHLVHVGPTLRKLSDRVHEGARFLEVFEVRRPRHIQGMADLCRFAGTKLHLRIRDAKGTGLKGVVVCAPDHDGAIVNLSFGIGLVEGVKRFRLNATDFAPTDLAIEMLYLVEAKSAAMQASRRLNQRLQGAMIAAEERSFTDTLTGLKNRRALEHVLERLVDFEIDFTLMHLDLDFFKSVNDTLGHAAGDFVLRRVAKVLASLIRGEDTVARVGGDEFVLVFHNPLPETRIAEISRKIIGELEKPIIYDGDAVHVSASIGVVQSTDHRPLDLQQLAADADLALYASKRAGRGGFTIFDTALRGTPMGRGRGAGGASSPSRRVTAAG